MNGPGLPGGILGFSRINLHVVLSLSVLIMKTPFARRRINSAALFGVQGFCPDGQHSRMADILLKTGEGGLHHVLHAPLGLSCRII